MGVLDVILGGNKKGGGGMSKIGLALIALMLWRWYQSAGRGGAEAPAPVPVPGPHGGTPLPRDSAPVPAPGGGSPGDSDFGPLVDSTRNMPRSGGGRRGRPRDDEDEEAGDGPMGGGLGDILNDILRGNAGRGGPGGGGMGDILNDILRGGAGGRGGPAGPRGGGGGGGLGDILGEILGSGRGMPPGARAMGETQSDPLGALLRGAGIGGLGGLLAGGASGGVLGDLLRQFEQSGHGEAARSWVSRDQNIPVTPAAIEQTFGSGIIEQLADQFGMDKNELLQGLSEVMPETINKLTPEGRLPTEQDIANWR